MGVRDYVEVLRRQWTTMLAVLLVSVLAGLALFLVAPSSYRSSVTFFMTGTLPGSDQLTAAQADELAQSRMPSYAAIVRSRSMAASVRQKLNLASPLTQVQHSISVRIPDKTIAAKESSRPRWHAPSPRSVGGFSWVCGERGGRGGWGSACGC